MLFFVHALKSKLLRKTVQINNHEYLDSYLSIKLIIIECLYNNKNLFSRNNRVI